MNSDKILIAEFNRLLRVMLTASGRGSFQPPPSHIFLDDVFCSLTSGGSASFVACQEVPGQSTCHRNSVRLFFVPAFLELRTAFRMTKSFDLLIPRVMLCKAQFTGP